MRNLGLLFIGAIGGIALVVACTSGDTGAGSSAHASPSDCAVFQVAHFSIDKDANGNYIDPPTADKPFELPKGWEPLTHDNEILLARRCKP